MKKGISLVSLAIVIVIIIILAGIVVITGLNSAEVATLNTFALEILNIQNAVDEYHFRYEKYPVGTDKILSMSEIETDFVDQFADETVVDEQITFKMVDLALIGINDTEFGKNKTLNDVYVLSEKTGKVYYLAGVKYEEYIYYTLTDSLYSVTNITDNTQVTSKDVKVYDVVFTPSSNTITNEPITVTVKIPKDATINSITTTNSKSVGEETLTGMYKQIEINTTSEDKAWNYEIIVNYTYNNVTKTAEYEVENYDATLPTITYLEEIENNLKTVIVTINNNGSEIKTVKYEEENISNTTYFKNYGKILTNNQFVVEKDDYFTIYVETTAGTIVTVNNIPENLKANVVDIVDGVPIPKGFTASSATGENTKDGGLVIYEGTEEVTDENVEKARRERNQYVWVPIASEEFTTKFIRQNFGKNYTITNTLGTECWEIQLDTETNMPLDEQDESYVSSATLAEAQAMYASVKKYEGFYVARYEAGVDNSTDFGNMQTNIYSVMGKIPCTGFIWGNSMSDDTGGVVEKVRKIYPATNSNTGVVSTLIYGVQWDSILQWWLDTKAVSTVKTSVDYGNYMSHVINEGDLNEGSKYKLHGTTNFYDVGNNTKDGSTAWLLTTGALKAAKVNNIYDMAGNEYEWTMEGRNQTTRNVRGRSYYVDDASNHVVVRGKGTLSDKSYSFRVALYIK